MRASHAILSLTLTGLPALSAAAPQPLLQSAGGEIIITECPPGGDDDPFCRAVAASGPEGQVRLGGGYMQVSLLWAHKSDPGQPDALVLGDYGGSGGRADLYAVTFTPHLSYRRIGGERFDSVTVDETPGPLRLSLPFDVEFFNGAPHAGAIVVPLPVIWSDGDFALDFAQLTHRTYSPSEFDFRVLAVGAELAAWQDKAYPAKHLYPPEAVGGTPVAATALVEMMLTGHADQARDLLDRSWPRDREQADKPVEGKAAFWAALCKAVVEEQSWKRFRLDRLPHADLIELAAQAS